MEYRLIITVFEIKYFIKYLRFITNDSTVLIVDYVKGLQLISGVFSA